MSINIFESAKEKEIPQWAKFVTAGDSVQGTYIGKIVDAIDGYGNKQIIYQLLTNDGKITNVGFGLNKKVINQEMMSVRFGQIIGFKFKGTIQVKDKFGKMVNVKDYGLHQDPKIVNEVWLKENSGNMPSVISMNNANPSSVISPEEAAAEREFSKFGVSEKSPVPTSDSIAPADKLAVIEKLAKDKLGVVEPFLMRDKVMEVTGTAFIPANYDKIIAALNTIGA